MPKHTKDFLMAYGVETAFASGKGATEYDATILEVTDTPTNLHLPAGSVTYPYNQYIREKVRSAGHDPKHVVVFHKGKNLEGDFKLPAFVNTELWLDSAIDDNNTNSYYFHIEDGDIEVDIMGCIVKEWVLSGSADEFPKEEVSFYYNQVKNSVVLTTPPVYTKTQPSVFKDIVFSIGPTGSLVTINELISYTITIAKEISEGKTSGLDINITPTVIENNGIIELNFYTDSATLAYDLRNESPTLIDVEVDRGITKTLSMTNMTVLESNINEVPEYGLWEISVTLENGGDSEFTNA